MAATTTPKTYPGNVFEDDRELSVDICISRERDREII